MFNRRQLTQAAVASLALVASACGGQSEPAPVKSSTQGVLEVLPPIAQQGPRPAKAKAAGSTVIATFTDAVGEKVTLEQSTDGGSWTSLAETEVAKGGRASFVTDGGAAAESVMLRVVSADNTERKLTTNAVAADSWGDPTFSDDFTGTQLSDAWYHRGTEYNPSGLRICSRGDEAAVRLEGGAVRIGSLYDPERADLCTAKRANGEDIGEFRYRINGHIATNEAYRYGVMAARVKFHRAAGQHGSFWMQTASENPGADNPAEGGAEIDVVEWFGDKSDSPGLATFYYYRDGTETVKVGDWVPNGDSFLAAQSDAWWKNYHVFSVHWTPERYVFYIDGQESWRSDEGISQQPETLILSLLSSDYELPNLPEPESLPQFMDVDWVRYWPLPDDAAGE